mgnify:CR=1 FL=1
MTATDEESGDALSPEAIEEVLRLLVAAPRRRLSSTRIDGRTVWIKRFDAEGRPLAKRLHGWLSPLMPAAFLRASPSVDGPGLAAREAGKAARFRAAGIATPAILWRGEAVLVLSGVADIGEPLLDRLRETDRAGHDELLVEMAAALGRAHAAGLCHGRPHPRDMFRRADGTWGYLDFEEEPEAAMPLATAQARDVWVLFMQIVARAQHEDTGARAFAAWRAEAPAGIVPELRKAVSRLALALPGLRLLRPVGLGKDGRNLLDAIAFLRSALRAGPNPLPAGAAGKPNPDRIGTPT